MNDKPEKAPLNAEIKKGFPAPPKPTILREGYAAPAAPSRAKPVPTTSKPVSAVQLPEKQQ